MILYRLGNNKLILTRVNPLRNVIVTATPTLNARQTSMVLLPFTESALPSTQGILLAITSLSTACPIINDTTAKVPIQRYMGK